MGEWKRDIPWRQGHLLDSDTIRALGMCNFQSPEKTAVIVVSHDCDLVQSIESEPNVEVIVGRLAEKADGNFTYSKNARKLHLEISQGNQVVVLELVSTEKQSISKKVLLGADPDPDLKIGQRGLEILQRWLAARYRRAAFSDEFDHRLKNATGMREKIRAILKRNGTHIDSIFFDVDNGEEVVHNGIDDPFKLVIYLVYGTETDEEVAISEAEQAAELIKKAFEEKCLKEQCWQWIELVECIAIADSSLTFFAIQNTERMARRRPELAPRRLASTPKL